MGNKDMIYINELTHIRVYTLFQELNKQIIYTEKYNW